MIDQFDASDALRLMSEVQWRVSQYVPGERDWIAKQNMSDGSNTYGFVVGKGFASCTIEEARARLEDDSFIRSLAEQILGFPVDSPQDAERRIQEAKQRIREINATIEQLEKQRDYWESYKAAALRLQV